jgi:hypothetical protein
MQRRPEQEAGLALVAAPALNHERAHWFQFCGSTIGSAALSLLRAEDVALLSALGEGALDPETKRYAEHALAKRRPLLGADHSLLPNQLRELHSILSDCRTMRSLLLGSIDPNRVPLEKLASLVTRSLAGIERAYAIHTGGSREWAAWDPQGNSERLASSIKRSGVGPPLDLSTRHVLEASALLNELGDFLGCSWRWGAPDAEFEPLTRDFEGYITDRLDGASTLYTACLTTAMQVWQEHLTELRGLSVPNFLARTYPALACCLDLAMNPQIGPISILGATCWEDLSAPHRYLRAIDAVSAVGVPERWLGQSEYAQYRETLREVSGLPFGHLDHRSFQHPRFDGEFFSTVEASDPLLPQTTHFDYLVWAMEGMHSFRRAHGLTWAMPQLLFKRQEDGPDLLLPLISPDYVWSAAPLYWAGTSLDIEARISEPFGVNLAAQLMMIHMLRQVVTRAGSFDLTASFPEEILGDENIVNMVLDGLVRATGFEALRAWKFKSPVASVEPSEPTIEFAEPARIKPTERTRLDLSRSDVEALVMDEPSTTFAQLRKDPLKNRFGLDLRFSGYDAKPQGLWDIVEVRAYVRRLRETFPFWPWYLAISRDPAEFVGPILFLVAGVEDPRQITLNEHQEFLTTMFLGLNLEADRVGLPESELEEMSMDIRDAAIGLMQVRLG